MSTVFVKPKLPASSPETAFEDDKEDNTRSINDVESLKNGVVNVSKNKTKAPYTILLVGEIGVGKSSVLELIANVLAGNNIDQYNFNVIDHINARGGSNQSQTNSPRLHEFTSKNGIVVRILDTPGLADTRGLQQDELHKETLAMQIEKHVDSISAVLVVANGTVPRVTVSTDYALSTLSAIFTDTLASRVAFMLSNVLSPLHCNFSKDTAPDVLKEAPQFLLNNPIALQRKYLNLRDNLDMKKRRTEFREAVKAGEQDALEMLVDLFDWLDGIEPQPQMKVAPLYKKRQTIVANIIAPLTRHMRELLRKLEKALKGVRKVKRT